VQTLTQTWAVLVVLVVVEHLQTVAQVVKVAMAVRKVQTVLAVVLIQ
jgi:hypothetical protein